MYPLINHILNAAQLLRKCLRKWKICGGDTHWLQPFQLLLNFFIRLALLPLLMITLKEYKYVIPASCQKSLKKDIKFQPFQPFQPLWQPCLIAEGRIGARADLIYNFDALRNVLFERTQSGT